MARVAMQWRQLISEDTSTLCCIGSRMRNLGLIPSTMPDASFLNILPMFYPRPSYEDDKWTVYPRKDVLCEHIFLEERCLVEREAATSAGRKDPGRPRYEDAYARLPRANVFDVHFRGDYVGPRAPPNYGPTMHTNTVSDLSFLSVSLVTSVNLVVRLRTTVLAMSSLLNQNAKEQVRLGSYLMRLWDATPSSFRSLRRFRPNDLLPDLEPPTESQSASSSAVSAFGGTDLSSIHSDDSDTPLSPPRSDRSAEALKSTVPSSLMADGSHWHSSDERKAGALLSPRPSKNRDYLVAAIRRFQNDSVDNQAAYGPVDPPHSEGETSNIQPEPHGPEARCARFTSNEWAAVLKGVDLGGILWYRSHDDDA
ncbi:hypothetical protein NEOLEDRAFT_1170563 [Neolentinus lepideus HHB14362 ss-1]|uniref:Uncharacterized protein n=1 Tax=Neolentinus lepideus HHB14362 ss-1 TaxID=1314782 RepID=A0A165RIQ9_9AGAM|nr:hypothetical protein NEOLEDRAFT_1170563 [Neolentinus lepideus HHB14362 ss-1]